MIVVFTGRHSGKVTVKTQNAKAVVKSQKCANGRPGLQQATPKKTNPTSKSFFLNESLVIMIIWVQQYRLSRAVRILKHPRDNTVIRRLRNLTDGWKKKPQNIQEDGAEFLNRPSGDTTMTTTSRHN